MLLGKHKKIAAVFLDVRKAFDSVPHHMLIKSLSSIGIQGSLLLWLQNYLTSRSQQVVLDGFSSDPVAVTSGVPQGSILGPLLFNIFMNSISTVPLSANCHLALYADDILIYKPIDNSTDLSTFQNDTQNIINWICGNGLTPNHTKTQLLPITRSRQQSPLSISINGHTISPCQSVKYLGVTLTQNLTWSQHIGNICKSSKKQLGLIHRQLRHAPSKLRHQIYRTTTLPRQPSPQEEPRKCSEVCRLRHNNRLEGRLSIPLCKAKHENTGNSSSYSKTESVLQHHQQLVLLTI